jgi:hypothetical protein
VSTGSKAYFAGLLIVAGAALLDGATVAALVIIGLGSMVWGACTAVTEQTRR